jgi:ribosome-associated protein
MKDHKFKEKSSIEIARIASEAALDRKAEDVIILDVRNISSFADCFIIMSGRSTRHVQGLADAVDSAMTTKRMRESSIEGLQEGRWVLLDYGDIVVHIFYKEDRVFYDLEGLWHDAPRVEVKG